MGIFDNDPEANIFTRYGVTIQFKDKVMGGTPKNVKMIQGWLRSKAGLTDDEGELRVATIRTLIELGVPGTQEQLDSMTFTELEVLSDQLAEQKNTNGFKRDENGLYLESRTLKAAIKENVNILFAGTEGWGITKKGARNFVAERVFVDPDRIYLGVQAPTGTEMFIGHTTGPSGPQSNLTNYEYVERATIQFTVDVTLDGVLARHWKQVWRHAQENGLGAMRSQGYGRFDILAWDKINQHTATVTATAKKKPATVS